jgi:hypothetical protein
MQRNGRIKTRFNGLNTSINTTEIMKKYTIKKGCNYSGFRIAPILFPKSVSFEFMFTEESKYQSEPHTRLRTQWNKLAGFSFDLIGYRSSRIAWRYDSDLDIFEVCYYIHVKGKFKVVDGSVQVAPINKISTVMLDGGYGFIGYRQFPHFGGKANAPNNVSIHLKFIK